MKRILSGLERKIKKDAYQKCLKTLRTRKFSYKGGKKGTVSFYSRNYVNEGKGNFFKNKSRSRA
jgi:hypothetical protein